MKKVMKRYLSVFLIVVMAFGLLQPITAKADATRKITLYVGESISFTTFSDVKSVASSNSKIVKISKSKKDKIYADILAQKPGEATVTIKTERETVKFYVTVKALDMKVKLVSIADGNVTFSIENKTKQTFDKVSISYSLRASKKSVVKEDTETVYDVLAKSKSYVTLYLGSAQTELIKKSASTVKINAVAHDPGEVYTDVSEKVKASIKNEKDEDDSVTFHVTVKNTTSKSVEGCYFVMIYGAGNKLLGVERCSIYLSKNATNTYTYGYISKYNYPEYDHYKIVVNAYCTERAKGW